MYLIGYQSIKNLYGQFSNNPNNYCKLCKYKSKGICAGDEQENTCQFLTCHTQVVSVVLVFLIEGQNYQLN